MFSFIAGDAVSDQSLQLHQRPQFVDYGTATASDWQAVLASVL